MTVYLSPVGGVAAQFFDSNGNPLSGGLLYTYVAGTTTPQASYTTIAGNIQHSNPIQLDAAGRVPGGEIWITSNSYKFVMQTANAVLVATWDNISGINTNSYFTQNFTGNGTTVYFSLSKEPGSENSTLIYINGVYQQKNTYSITGATLIFSEAPPYTSSIEVLIA